MKFKTPSDTDVVLALTSGHTLTIKADGSTTVPPHFRKSALAAECVPAGMNIEDLNPGTEPTKEEKIRTGIEKMIEKDDSDDFTATGKPDAAKLSTLVGFNVSASERDAAWQPFADEIAELEKQKNGQ